MMSFLVHVDVKEIRGIGLQVSKLQNVDISRQGKFVCIMKAFAVS